MTVGCQGVVKLISKVISYHLVILCFYFLYYVLFFVFMFDCSYGRMTGNAFDPLPLPSGVLVPMCFCGDPCKLAKSDEENTYRQRY